MKHEWWKWNMIQLASCFIFTLLSCRMADISRWFRLELNEQTKLGDRGATNRIHLSYVLFSPYSLFYFVHITFLYVTDCFTSSCFPSNMIGCPILIVLTCVLLTLFCVLQLCASSLSLSVRLVSLLLTCLFTCLHSSPPSVWLNSIWIPISVSVSVPAPTFSPASEPMSLSQLGFSVTSPRTKPDSHVLLLRLLVVPLCFVSSVASLQCSPWLQTFSLSPP